MSPKPKFFKTLAEGQKALTALGIDPGHMSLKELAVTYNEQLKRNAKAAVAPKVTAVTPKVASDTIGSLKASIKTEKNISTKVNMLQTLRSNLVESLNASRSDITLQAETLRELQSAEKKLAYSLLAERTLDPKAAKARRFMEFADRN